MTDIENILKEKFEDNQLLFNEPMKRHTSFKIGGAADILVLPKSIEEIVFLIKLFESEKVNYFVMGNGTNLLVSDKGFRGVIIKISKNFSEINVNNNIITANAGVFLSQIANIALKNELTGFEFASGIPGSLGGAVCMNAGAYGSEMKNVIKSIDVIYNGDIYTLSADEAEFEYRNSRILKEKMTVLSAKIQLKNGNYQDIASLMNSLKEKRNEKQPMDMPSAGSAFKRPKDNFAGKLIMDAGLRGFSIGGAQVSEKHCGFIVNKKDACCDDVLRLCKKIKEVVYEKFGVELEEEIRFIGE